MNIPERLVPIYLRATHTNAPFRTAEGAAEVIQSQALRPASFNPPAKLRPDVTISVRREDQCPVYTVSPKLTTPTGSVLYTHGGGWVHEISPQHWALVAQIAAEARVAVTVPIYKLLPYGDAAQVNELILRLFHDLESRHTEVRLAGDSAGGQITLSAALSLRDQGVENIHTVLISPALELTLSNPRIPAVLPTDPWLGVDGTRVLAENWAADLPIDDPRVSPLLGDMRGLGPMLLFSGTHDILNPDAHLLLDKARAAGVDVTFIERPDAVHVFPLLPTRSAEAARERVVAALRP
ncbi:alpha/beta hydrolase fold domain-containing protein [Nocardia wallacei]|uniref:alpha/beta hydrolase fold domain-containing protein n=1 Tax=Nocardia wallacei TaxID=480035 RepID=UPI00245880FA|nr:alpha/beta hydrolase fold domain-containing protein [Nocardia wallacei]